MDDKKTNTTQQTQKLGARSLLKKIFNELGARLRELENGHFEFGYNYGKDRSEYFIVQANDEDVNICIIDLRWYELSKWDLENVTWIQSQINKCNSKARSKVVYDFTDDDMMQLTTILTCPLYEDIPGLGSYFVAQLDDMMQTHKAVLGERYEELMGERFEDADCEEEEGGEE